MLYNYDNALKKAMEMANDFNAVYVIKFPTKMKNYENLLRLEIFSVHHRFDELETISTIVPKSKSKSKPKGRKFKNK